MMKGRHFLFTSEVHDDVCLDFLDSTINKLLELWNKGYDHEYICNKLRIKPIDMALIVMDLEYADKLPKRKNGFLGSKSIGA